MAGPLCVFLLLGTCTTVSEAPEDRHGELRAVVEHFVGQDLNSVSLAIQRAIGG